MSSAGQQVVQLESNGQVALDKGVTTEGLAAAGLINSCRIPVAGASGVNTKSVTTMAFHLLVTLTVTVVCANLAMNIFLIRVLQLTRSGMSSVKFSASTGIWLRDHAVFADLLRTTRLSHVNYNKEQPNDGLLMTSGKNIHIESNNRAGQVNSLSLSNGRLEARGQLFEVLSDKNSEPEVLFRADQGEVVVAADQVPVSAPNGFNLRGSLLAKTVRGSPHHDLRLESPLNEVNIRSGEELLIESKAEHINVRSVNTVNIQSQDGTIVLNSHKLEIKDLPIVAVRSVRVKRGQTHLTDDQSGGVTGPDGELRDDSPEDQETDEPASEEQDNDSYALCTCKNGKLFAVGPDDNCRASPAFCNESGSNSND